MNWIILLPVILPLLGAVSMLCMRKWLYRQSLRLGTVCTVAGTFLAVLAVVLSDDAAFTVMTIMPGLPVYFHADGLAKLFAVLTVTMWLLSTVFSFAYMNYEEREESYQTFSLLSLAALLGVCFSGNLLTTYLFYEMMTLATFPLVLHEQTKEAVSAGLTYLFYSIAGAFLGLVGIFFLFANASEGSRAGGTLGYVAGGFLAENVNTDALLVIVFLMLVGLACKAGMFPLHGWLPKAHPVAPAPASALLSGNITKMGVLFTVRVIFYSVGPQVLAGTWVQKTLLALSLTTVFLGSMLAFREKMFKKRLAYSTVSQVSYCLTGIYMMTGVTLTGALMHVVFHSIIKNLLFLSAGAVICTTGRKKVEELNGIGKKMPVTMWCFTLGGLALVGIPPMSGFISKWYLATGALHSGLPVYEYLVPVILLISALLTAGYLLTITADAFFGRCEEDSARVSKSALMLIPLILLAALALYFGLFPKALSQFITDFLKEIPFLTGI